MTLVVYGDFNCPYSYLASSRVDGLLDRGVDVEWRAVEHDPTIPPPSRSVDGELADMLDREVADVSSLLAPEETFRIARPRIQPNTRAATRAFAALDPAAAHDVRRGLFAALWVNGCDIGAGSVVRDLTGGAGSTQAASVVAEWRASWLARTRPVVPMLVLDDGYVSRGLGALTRLAGYSRGNADPTAEKPTGTGIF